MSDAHPYLISLNVDVINMSDVHPSLLSCLYKQTAIVLGFNDTSTLEGHFVVTQRKGEKRQKRK